MAFPRLIEIDGVIYASEDDYPHTQFAGVSDGYFNVFGVSILEGRSFNQTDIAESQQVARPGQEMLRPPVHVAGHQRPLWRGQSNGR